ncbi:MAG: protein translocase subunit SecF [Chitinispirillales bacterium]|jgi:preprotein translocase SecF subunit|nr:protein translocase subunit SecF [Chitinispirillales bacterium]
MLQIFKNTKYEFLRHSKTAIVVSLVFIVGSIASVFVHGGFNWSIDFAGGTTVQIKFEQPVRDELNNIRNAVGALGFGQPEIKTIGIADSNEIQITVRNQEEGVNVSDSITAALVSALPGNGFNVLRTESVGPKIGGELRRDAVISSLLALLAILVYIGIRFKPSYAVASVIPLFHNVLVVVGVFAMFKIELTLSFLAAVMMVIGYSLNDTIVVFDRIRENLKNGLRGRKFEDAVNVGVNQTLSRTVITTGTTLFTVVVLYMLGSDSIKDFALALTIGIAVGPYSTIFIATHVLARWHKKWPIVK